MNCSKRLRNPNFPGADIQTLKPLFLLFLPSSLLPLIYSDSQEPLMEPLQHLPDIGEDQLHL